MRKWIMWATIFVLLAGASVARAERVQGEIPIVPTKGMVTMLDLGAHKCIPCKMMAPIIEKVKKDYKGRASIVFIDIWENREEAVKYGIRAIPTQIFFDKKGKEAYRHIGFMSEKQISNQLKKMGVD